jgi:hypothetical protein
VRSQAAEATAVAMAKVVAAAAAVAHDLIHVRNGMTVTALTDQQRSDVSIVANRAILPMNAGPRRRRAKQIWPRRRNPCSCW